mmetsp:Transcript_17158/g.23885  ORF Transcript_17158/g.23885 Transcript_17158/m.23885 type:complete len:201 (-) Transcript_17158:585-1187(-)
MSLRWSTPGIPPPPPPPIPPFCWIFSVSFFTCGSCCISCVSRMISSCDPAPPLVNASINLSEYSFILGFFSTTSIISANSLVIASKPAERGEEPLRRLFFLRLPRCICRHILFAVKGFMCSASSDFDIDLRSSSVSGISPPRNRLSIFWSFSERPSSHSWYTHSSSFLLSSSPSPSRPSRELSNPSGPAFGSNPRFPMTC